MMDGTKLNPYLGDVVYPSRSSRWLHWLDDIGMRVRLASAKSNLLFIDKSMI